MCPVLSIAVAALLPGTPLGVSCEAFERSPCGGTTSKSECCKACFPHLEDPYPLSFLPATGWGVGHLEGVPESERWVALWPYHTSAAGLHSKMLLVNGLKCSQGKSATFSRNLGTCVGSRGPIHTVRGCPLHSVEENCPIDRKVFQNSLRCGKLGLSGSLLRQAVFPRVSGKYSLMEVWKHRCRSSVHCLQRKRTALSESLLDHDPLGWLYVRTKEGETAPLGFNL